jgi:hypothetical protein
VLQQPVAQSLHTAGVGGEGAHGLLATLQRQRGDELLRAYIDAGCVGVVSRVDIGIGNEDGLFAAALGFAGGWLFGFLHGRQRLRV